MKTLIKRLFLSRILAGPFQGMAYLRDTTGSGLLPKIFGVYERELFEVFEPWLRQPGLHVIDVGAAEGYYAVGFLVRNPGAQVTAFEMDPTGRDRLVQLAELNCVRDRLQVLGECTPSGLHESLLSGPGARLLMDVEGAEKFLLDPASCPALANTEILVEMHDWTDPGLGDLIRGRFQGSHTLHEIPAAPRRAADVKVGWVRLLASLNGWLESRLLTERPPGMRWFHLVPRGNPGRAT